MGIGRFSFDSPFHAQADFALQAVLAAAVNLYRKKD
jgi:hypothetical protein